jgi:hypothetical protein
LHRFLDNHRRLTRNEAAAVDVARNARNRFPDGRDVFHDSMWEKYHDHQAKLKKAEDTIEKIQRKTDAQGCIIDRLRNELIEPYYAEYKKEVTRNEVECPSPDGPSTQIFLNAAPGNADRGFYLRSTTRSRTQLFPEEARKRRVEEEQEGDRSWC